jgi:hypothetical protein
MVAWVLSLGPMLKVFDSPLSLMVDDRQTYIPLPFALIGSLPVLDIIRTPARFNFVVGFAVAVMAGYGAAVVLNDISRLWGRLAMRTGQALSLRIFTIVSIALIALDYQLTFSSLPTVPAAIPDEIAALATDGSVEAVITLPHNNLLVAKEAMYLQTAHQKPLIAGFVSRETPVSLAKREVLQTTLDPALLDVAGVDVVILFRQWDADLNMATYATLGPPFYEDDRIAAFRIPEPTTPLTTQIVTRETDAHVYIPSDGWAILSATLPDETREIMIEVEGEPLSFPFAPSSSLAFPVPLSAGYQTVSLSLAQPCPPTAPHPALACEPLTPENLSLSLPLMPSTVSDPIGYSGGIQLSHAALFSEDDAVTVALDWRFENPPDENTIRFVHLVNGNGEQVAGDDRPLLTAQRHVEAVTLPLPDDLPPGDYEVFVGWYTFPDLTRLDVLSNVEGADSNWTKIGQIQVN